MKKNLSIEAEGGELILRNQAGTHVIIPKAHRIEVEDMIKQGCHDCIDAYVKTLPVMGDYAKDGTLIPEWPPKNEPVDWKMKTEQRPFPPPVEDTPQGNLRLTKEIHKEDLAKKQQYWDTLPAKYGEGVKNRQIYLDLYEKEIPPLQGFNAKNSLYDKTDDKLTPELKKIKAAYWEVQNKWQKAVDSPPGFDRPESEFNAYDSLVGSLEIDRNNITGDWMNNPDNINYITNKPTNWKQVINSNPKIKDQSLLFASMMDEGGDYFTDNPRNFNHDGLYMGFETFGLDRIGERADEFIKKGYLDKDFKNRITPSSTRNEKNEVVESANFSDLNDIVAAKNAFLLAARENIDSKAKAMGLTLSADARDYFTIASYNSGEKAAQNMMDTYKKKGWLENEKFLKMDKLPLYSQPHQNALRRLQAKHMLEGEGIINPTNTK